MKWEYRWDIVDGPTRSGSLLNEEKKLALPVLLDIHNRALEGEDILVDAPSGGWDRDDLRMEFDAKEGSVHPFAEECLRTALVDMGVPTLSRAPGILSFGLFEKDNELPIVSVPLFDVLFTGSSHLPTLFARLMKEDPSHAPVYLPGAADGDNIELLFYMGCEVFDTSRAHRDAHEGWYYTDTGKTREEEVKRHTGEGLPCPVCAGEEGLAGHNVHMLRDRLSNAAMMLSMGRLRELVMSRLSGKPHLSSVLRRFECDNKEVLGIYASTYRKDHMRPVSYREDLRDPDLALWETRIEAQYEPPDWKDILLIVPCSAKKPYSRSRTHQRIYSALSGIRRWRDRVHPVVLTSPLGVVPVELEELYPAAHYDIPVTGEWYPEELERSRRMLKGIVEKGSYSRILNLHRDGRLFFGDAQDQLFGVPYTDIMVEEDPYASLKKTVEELLRTGTHQLPEWPELEDALISIRFSMRCPGFSPEGARYHRSRRGREIRRGRETLFVFNEGGPVPGFEGGKELWEHLYASGKGPLLQIDDFVPKGTIFNQGVIDADPDIHAGDVVLVSHSDEYRGVGRALVPGCMMNTDLKGPAVKMLRHIHTG